MTSKSQLFAEAHYQTAFDRGVTAADELFSRIAATDNRVPDEWPGSFMDATCLVSDLARADLPGQTRRLLAVVAHGGSFVRWRCLMRDALRQSGPRICAGMMPVPRSRRRTNAAS